MRCFRQIVRAIEGKIGLREIFYVQLVKLAGNGTAKKTVDDDLQSFLFPVAVAEVIYDLCFYWLLFGGKRGGLSIQQRGKTRENQPLGGATGLCAGSRVSAFGNE